MTEYDWAAISNHDPLCRAERLHPTASIEQEYNACDCDLIAKVRADERERCKQEVEATAKWCREDERETIAAAIEAMPPETVWAYNGSVVLRADAARIARNGGRDE